MTIKRRRVELLVVGAGAAGLAASLAAARTGAQVQLVEYQGHVGGNSAILPWLGFHSRDYRQVVKGMPLQLVRRLQELGAGSSIVLDPVVGSAWSFDAHTYRWVMMEELGRAGVSLLLHTHVVDAVRVGDRVTGVVVWHKGGTELIEADMVIDTSGDGDVAVAAGVEWEKGRTADGLVQAPTLVFRVGGVDRSAFLGGLQRLGTHRDMLRDHPDVLRKLLARLPGEEVVVLGGLAPMFEEATRSGALDVPTTRMIGVLGHRPDEFVAVSTKVSTFDPVDIDVLSAAYQDAYRQIPQLMNFFRDYVPGFADSHLREIAPMIGVRESRRIMGDYVLTGEDVASGAQFPDVVAMGAYHIDIHRPDGSWVDSRSVRPYDIPLRSLIARGVEGLLMAGKCMSATHEAIASARVIPICMAQGQAAGTAAAMALSRGLTVRDLPTAELQAKLIEDGAELRQTLGEPDPELMDRLGSIP